MEEQKIIFTCWNCQQKTTVIVTVAEPRPAQRQKVPVVHYCAHCQQPNKVPLPDNLDVHSFILGRDKGFLGYSSSRIPILQGEKDV